MIARTELLLAALLFGTTGTAQALAGVGEPLAVGAARVGIGGAALLAVALAAGALRGLGPALPTLAVAAAGVAVYQAAFFAAVDATGVAVGTVVAIGSAPAVTGLLEWRLEGVWPGRRWLVATGLAVAGVVVLGVAAGGDRTLDPAGLGLALVAGGGYATYAVLARRLLARGHRGSGVMAASFGGGALLLAPLLVAGGGALAAPSGLALVLYLGLVPTALAYLLYARGLRRVTAAEASTVVLAEPLTAALLGALVLGERLDPAAATGGALVLAALLVLIVPAGGRRRVPAAACSA